MSKCERCNGRAHGTLCERCETETGLNERITELDTRTPDKTLVEFARKVIKQNCWGIILDGLEIQDLAEELGLLTPAIATEADVDDESDFEVGDKMYKFTDILKEKD